MCNYGIEFLCNNCAINFSTPQELNAIIAHHMKPYAFTIAAVIVVDLMHRLGDSHVMILMISTPTVCLTLSSVAG